MQYNKFGMLFEPFFFADTFGFTVYRDTISREEVMDIYDKCKRELGINFSFHTNDLYYETNDYSEGNTKYFREYCIDLLSTLHKKIRRIELKKRKKYLIF